MKGEAYGTQLGDDYTANRYHKPSDEFDPAWDLGDGTGENNVASAEGFGFGRALRQFQALHLREEGRELGGAEHNDEFP